MAKYKVLKGFKDKYTKKRHRPGQIIEMKVERAEEAMKKQAERGGGYLERIEDPKTDDGEDEGNSKGNKKAGD